MKLSLARWERIEVNIFEALFALLGVLLGALVPLSGGSDPQVSSSAAFYMAVGPVIAYLWAAALALSGLCILVALWKSITWRYGRALEAFGLVMFAALLAIQGVVIGVVLGSGGISGSILRLAIVPGFLFKLRVILRGEYIALVKPDA